MLVTETEALTKVCRPVVAVPDGAGGTVAMADGGGTGAEIAAGPYAGRPACIGSVCMLWRWAGDPRPASPTGKLGFCGAAVDGQWQSRGQVTEV